MSQPDIQAEYGEKIELMQEQCQIVLDTLKALRETIDNSIYETEITINSIKKNL